MIKYNDMKNIKLTGRILSLIVICGFMMAVSCKNATESTEANEPATESTTNSDDSSEYDSTSETGDSMQPQPQTEAAAQADTSTTTNNGNRTAKGSGL